MNQDGLCAAWWTCFAPAKLEQQRALDGAAGVTFHSVHTREMDERAAVSSSAVVYNNRVGGESRRHLRQPTHRDVADVFERGGAHAEQGSRAVQVLREMTRRRVYRTDARRWHFASQRDGRDRCHYCPAHRCKANESRRRSRAGSIRPRREASAPLRPRAARRNHGWLRPRGSFPSAAMLETQRLDRCGSIAV